MVLFLVLGLTIAEPRPQPGPLPVFRVGKTLIGDTAMPPEGCFPTDAPSRPRPALPPPPTHPGTVTFEADPASPAWGERYEVRVLFKNEGPVALDIQSLVLAATRDGKRVSGPMAPLAKAVASGETVTLLEVADRWNALVSWTLEADLVATVESSGLKARYRNQLSWSASRPPTEADR